MNPDYFKRTKDLGMKIREQLYRFKEPTQKLDLSNIDRYDYEHIAKVWNDIFPSWEFPNRIFGGKPEKTLDLNSCDLSNSIFIDPSPISRSVFTYADFSNSKLDDTIWIDVNLSFSNFTSASLHNCIILNSNLEGTLFIDADLSGSTLGWKYPPPNFYKPPIDFTNANLNRTVLYIQEKISVILKNAVLDECIISLSNLDKLNTEDRNSDILSGFLHSLSKEVQSNIKIVRK